jgi:hypothetical protein
MPSHPRAHARCIATACALLPRYKIACIWQLSSSCQPRQIFVQALDEARSRDLKGRKSVMGNGPHKVATRRTCQAIHALMRCIATACALLPRCKIACNRRKSVMGNGAHKVATRRTCQAIHALMRCIATACALLPRCKIACIWQLTKSCHLQQYKI